MYRSVADCHWQCSGPEITASSSAETARPSRVHVQPAYGGVSDGAEHPADTASARTAIAVRTRVFR